MTFQEKYAEKRNEAQKVLEELRCKIDIDDYADIIFKAIYDKLDEKVAKEYNVERIKKDNSIRLENQFRVGVRFFSNFVEVSGEDVGLHFNVSLLQEQIKKTLTKKLREVGVDLEKGLGDDFYAHLVFKNKSDG